MATKDDWNGWGHSVYRRCGQYLRTSPLGVAHCARLGFIRRRSRGRNRHNQSIGRGIHNACDSPATAAWFLEPTSGWALSLHLAMEVFGSSAKQSSTYRTLRAVRHRIVHSSTYSQFKMASRSVSTNSPAHTLPGGENPPPDRTPSTLILHAPC